MGRAWRRVDGCGPRQRLARLHYRARVFSGPVGFAGGVPAKVLEAAAQGIPVAASALLVRQLGWREGIDIQAGCGQLRMRVEGPALQLGMVLHADEPGMVGVSDRLRQQAGGGCAGAHARARRAGARSLNLEGRPRGAG